MDLTPSMIENIVQLFNPEEEIDNEDDGALSNYAKLGPGHIGPVRQPQDTSSAAAPIANNTKDIWSEGEVLEGSEYDLLNDPRPQPEYEILFSQCVTSEDIFLQMGNKTPSSASCENMTVKIKLPNTKMSEVELDVKQKFLDCRAPKFKLGLHLPHNVDHKNGKAQWDSKTETLVVTLRMLREFDVFNF